MSQRISPRKLKRVALFIESMMAPRRDLMNGVARFMQEHEPWSIYLKPPFVEGSLRQWIREWQGDGIIGVMSDDVMEALSGTNIPVVDLRGIVKNQRLGFVSPNNHAIGRMGAGHLLERGFKHFAFCQHEVFWSQHRREGFESRLAEAGAMCHLRIFDKPSAGPYGPGDWDRNQRNLADWIGNLPKPVGIMATTDFLGRLVLEACQRFGFVVPDEVAVLGVDNDEPICRISTPPLSSVILDDEQRGYEAASLLFEMMAGHPEAARTVLIPPVGIVTRASTDVLAIEDEIMVDALRFLREHMGQPIGADEVAAALSVSRSTLERRFRRVLGRSINDEVVRLRVNYAVQLLSETKLPISTIAARCGFSSQSYMNGVFNKQLGRTPGSYRH